MHQEHLSCETLSVCEYVQNGVDIVLAQSVILGYFRFTKKRKNSNEKVRVVPMEAKNVRGDFAMS